MARTRSTKPAPGHYRCLTTFVVGTEVVHAGTIVTEDHPLLAGRESLFEVLVPVEAATANPGERRSTKRPK